MSGIEYPGGVDDKSGRPAHEIVYLGARLAKCRCGWRYQIPDGDFVLKRDAQNELLDRHKTHWNAATNHWGIYDRTAEAGPESAAG
jgi:hypothetical protein